MPLLVSLIGFALALQIHSFVLPSKESQSIYDPPPLVHLPREVVDVLFLGNHEIYQDFIHIWLLQALTEDPEDPDPKKMSFLIESVLRHLPKSQPLYMLSCFVMTKTYQSPKNCETIIQYGLTVFPESFRLLMTQGYISGFVLKDHLKASAYYYRAAQIPSAPAYVAGVAKKFAKKEPLDPSETQNAIQSILGPTESSQFIEFLKKAGMIKPHE